MSKWVKARFDASWAVGCEWCLSRDPVSCFIAVERTPNPDPSDLPYHAFQEKILGFACYDVAAKGMFGAMGVDEAYQERGIGRALLLSCLHAMKAERYAYAVIGWAGEPDFYTRCAGATPIEDSTPSFWESELWVE